MSPPRSNRGSKTAPAKAAAAKAAKSRPAAGRSGPAGQWDEYHTLLAVSMGAILIGALMLILVLNKYEFKTTATGALTNQPALTETLA